MCINKLRLLKAFPRIRSRKRKGPVRRKERTVRNATDVIFIDVRIRIAALRFDELVTNARKSDIGIECVNRIAFNDWRKMFATRCF